MTTKSPIINPIEDQQRRAALAQPHALFVADEILSVNIDGFLSAISLGHKSPTGTIAPALTVKMPLPTVLALANKILEEAKAHKTAIVSSHQSVTASIET